MKIGIIGLGAVGTANKKGFEYIGHEVLIHDTKLGTNIQDVFPAEVIFICVPTPKADNGSCDTSIIQNVIRELNLFNYKGIVAIRSTVEPGFTKTIIEKYKKLKFCFVPEFLRERCAEDDFIFNHELLAVGTDSVVTFRKIKQAHGNLPNNTIHLTPTEAEILKYYNNLYAALRITFANVMYELCQKYNTDYSVVKDAYIKTGKAKDIYLDVNDNLRGYGGMCLPKDVSAINYLFDKFNLDYSLLNSIQEDNKKFKTTVFNGMRDDE
jgi:UDPglucose 6-dehydrogenase